jgi:hypothetical protein
MRAALCVLLAGLTGCASARVAREEPPQTEFAGSFYENAQESIFFPCGVKLSEDGWWVRFREGIQAHRIRYQYKGSGFPTASHDVRVRGRLTPVQRIQSPIRYGTGFHTRELVIEDVLEVRDPGSICAGYEKNPGVWQGAGPTGSRIMGAAASDDKALVAIMEFNGDVTLWKSATGELIRRFPSGNTFAESQGPDVRMWFNPRATLLAEAGNDGYVRVWGVPDGELRWKLAHSTVTDSLRDSTGRVTHIYGGGPVSRIAFSPDGESLVSVGAWRAFTWSMNTGKVLDTLQGVGLNGLGAPAQAVVARNPSRIIASGEDGLMRGYTLTEGRPIFAAKVERVGRGEMVISPDNRWIAILVGQDSVSLWSIGEGRITQALSFPNFFNGGMAFSPDSKRLAISGGAGAIYIWDVLTGAPLRSVHGLPGWARRIWFNARGDSIVFSSVFGKELYVVPVATAPRDILRSRVK